MIREPFFGGYFSPGASVALAREIDRWAGTRFGAFQCIRGVAADCVRWVEAVYRTIGALRSPLVWPRYVCTKGGPPMLGVMRETLGTIPELGLVWDRVRGTPCPLFQTGDMLLFSDGKRGHHLAIYSGGNRFHHCHIKSGVTEGNIHDPLYLNNLVCIFRFYAY